MSKTALESCTRIPLSKLLTPFGNARVRCRLWWVIVDGDALFYHGYAAQCNANKEIVDRIRDKLYPGADVTFIETAFCPEEP